MLRFYHVAQGIWRFQLICVGTYRLVPWLHCIDQSQSCTLSEVDIIFSLLTFLINTSSYRANTTSTRLLHEASYCKRPCAWNIAPEEIYNFCKTAVSSELPVTFSACQTCPFQAQEEVLDPYCEPYAQPSPWLSSLDQSKWGLDEQRLITKSFAGCFVLPMEGSQSSLTSVWTSLASSKSLSVVNLVRPLQPWYLMRCAGNWHSVETSETDSGHGSVTV